MSRVGLIFMGTYLFFRFEDIPMKSEIKFTTELTTDFTQPQWVDRWQPVRNSRSPDRKWILISTTHFLAVGMHYLCIILSFIIVFEDLWILAWKSQFEMVRQTSSIIVILTLVIKLKDFPIKFPAISGNWSERSACTALGHCRRNLVFAINGVFCQAQPKPQLN